MIRGSRIKQPHAEVRNTFGFTGLPKSFFDVQYRLHVDAILFEILTKKYVTFIG